MVVCKFFLQGNCRYGEMCKFEHQSDGSNSTSILRQQNFNTISNNMQSTTVDTNTLLQSVASDMISAEKGGQWLLSSYAPFKEKIPFPGFDDQSFEEVRWGFYEAQLNGTVSQYCQQLYALLQNTLMQMKLLQNPNAEIMNTLRSIYYSTSSNMNNILAQSNQKFSTPSIFAAANQKFFGALPPQANPDFRDDQNIFGNSGNNVNQNAFLVPQQFQQPYSQPPSFQQSNRFQQPQLQEQNFVNSVSSTKDNIFNIENHTQSNFSPLTVYSNSSLFGSHENTVIPSFTQKANVKDENVYSKPEDLSEEDKKRYEGESFEFGNIPEKPPTIQMCF